MNKFKSIVATATAVYLVPSNGSNVVTLVGRNLLTQEDLFLMLEQIRQHGETTLESKLGTLEQAYVEYLESLQAEIGMCLANLENHIKTALVNQTDNLKRFIARLARTDKSPELQKDIIDFVAASDMPITANGDILGYRRVVTKPDGTLVDNYTRTIPQNVGSTIWMDPSVVDDDRSRGCSAGLHVGTIGYVACYTGNVLQLVLTKPEAIVSVPYADKTKLRTSEYTILHQFEEEDLRNMINNKRNAEFADILNPFINGKVVEITQFVDATDSASIRVEDIYEEAVDELCDDEHEWLEHEQKDSDDKNIDISSFYNFKVIDSVTLLQAAANSFKLAVKRYGTHSSAAKDIYDRLLQYKRHRKRTWKNLLTPELAEVLEDYEKDLKQKK